MGYFYIGNCTSLNGRLIEKMTAHPRRVSYGYAMKRLGHVLLEVVFPDYNWRARKSFGLRMKDDYAVEFYTSQYGGHPCIYVVHSAIEYVFLEQGGRKE